MRTIDLDLDDIGTYAATLRDDGRISLDIGDGLTVTGTKADLLDLGATITSMALSVTRKVGYEAARL